MKIQVDKYYTFGQIELTFIGMTNALKISFVFKVITNYIGNLLRQFTKLLKFYVPNRKYFYISKTLKQDIRRIYNTLYQNWLDINQIAEIKV